MEEKQRNGILIVIAFFELRRMNFSKTWIELIIWGTISKRACYKWRVSTNIPKHWNQWGKWVATLFKNFFVSWYPTRVLYISTGGRILDETLPLVIRVSLFMSWYQTKRSFICLIYHLWYSLDITRDSVIRFWTHAVSAGISCVFVKSRWLNIRRNTPSRLL